MRACTSGRVSGTGDGGSDSSTFGGTGRITRAAGPRVRQLRGLLTRARLGFRFARPIGGNRLQDFGEALAVDESHRKIVHSSLAADRIDRHDVRMFQRRRGPGLVLEPLQLLFVEHAGKGQHFERHRAAQRNLLGLIDDPHAAAADFANQAEVAQRAVDQVVRAGPFARLSEGDEFMSAKAGSTSQRTAAICGYRSTNSSTSGRTPASAAVRYSSTALANSSADPDAGVLRAVFMYGPFLAMRLQREKRSLGRSPIH